MKVDTIIRSVADIKSGCNLPVKDPEGLLLFNSGRVSAYSNNPFLESIADPSQFVGVVDEEVIGGINVFPLRVVANGNVLLAEGGDSLYVRERYRSTMYPIPLMDKLNNLSKDKISLCAGFTVKSVQVIKILGNVIFPLRQFIFVRHSMPLLQRRFSKTVARICGFVVDVILLLHRLLINVILLMRLHGYKLMLVESASVSDCEEFSRLIEKDGHLFREHIPSEWLRWVIENDFHPKDVIGKGIVRISLKGETVGYALVRWGNEQKSQCVVGKILEWQVEKSVKRDEPFLLMKVAIWLLKKSHYVVLSVSAADDVYCNLFRRLMPSTSRYVVSIGTGKDSPLRKISGYKDAYNWRIRPGMGDMCFF